MSRVSGLVYADFRVELRAGSIIVEACSLISPKLRFMALTLYLVSQITKGYILSVAERLTLCMTSWEFLRQLSHLTRGGG